MDKNGKKNDDDENEGGNEHKSGLLFILALIIIGFALGKFSTVEHSCRASVSLTSLYTTPASIEEFYNPQPRIYTF